MKKILLIITIALLTIGCEDYDDITYYDVVGEGYVFAYDSVGVLHPVKGVEIIVDTKLEGGSGFFGSNIPNFEVYTTDANGKYRIKFIKRTLKKMQ